MRIKASIFFVSRQGRRTELVNPRIDNQTHDLPEIEFAGDKLAVEQAPEFRIGRRITRAQVIHLLDQANSEEMFPEAIDHGAAEILIGRIGNPLRQGTAQVLARTDTEHRTVNRLRRHWLFGPWLPDR